MKEEIDITRDFDGKPIDFYEKNQTQDSSDASQYAYRANKNAKGRIPALRPYHAVNYAESSTQNSSIPSQNISSQRSSSPEVLLERDMVIREYKTKEENKNVKIVPKRKAVLPIAERKHIRQHSGQLRTFDKNPLEDITSSDEEIKDATMKSETDESKPEESKYIPPYVTLDRRLAIKGIPLREENRTETRILAVTAANLNSTFSDPIFPEGPNDRRRWTKYSIYMMDNTDSDIVVITSLKRAASEMDINRLGEKIILLQQQQLATIMNPTPGMAVMYRPINAMLLLRSELRTGISLLFLNLYSGLLTMVHVLNQHLSDHEEISMDLTTIKSTIVKYFEEEITDRKVVHTIIIQSNDNKSLSASLVGKHQEVDPFEDNLPVLTVGEYKSIAVTELNLGPALKRGTKMVDIKFTPAENRNDYTLNCFSRSAYLAECRNVQELHDEEINFQIDADNNSILSAPERIQRAVRRNYSYPIKPFEHIEFYQAQNGKVSVTEHFRRYQEWNKIMLQLPTVSERNGYIKHIMNMLSTKENRQYSVKGITSPQGAILTGEYLSDLLRKGAEKLTDTKYSDNIECGYDEQKRIED